MKQNLQVYVLLKEVGTNIPETNNKNHGRQKGNKGQSVFQVHPFSDANWLFQFQAGVKLQALNQRISPK